jgi:Uma2 family endonuclease
MNTWAEICADPILRNLPYKIETNRYNQIMMTPVSAGHGGSQGDLVHYLRTLLPAGKVIVECPIDTADGVKVPDVAWMELSRWRMHRHEVSLSVCPEICIEVLSPSNSDGEMRTKMGLYFSAGAEEVWLCEHDGKMRFFSRKYPGKMSASEICPGFPLRIEDV